MVHRIVQVALASLLTSTLAAGAAWAQEEPAGGDEPAGDGTTEPAGDGTTEPAAGEGGGEAGGEMAPAAEAPKQMRFGVAGVVAIPLSPEGFTDSAGIGIGILGGVTYAMSEKLALAGNVGLVYHLAKNDITTMEIPILAGVRFMVIPKLALGADTGINILRVSGDPLPESQTNTRIPLAIHAAYMLNMNLSVGAGLWIPNLLLTDDGEDTALELVAYVGYMF